MVCLVIKTPLADSNQFYLWSSNPPYCGELSLQEEMVCLVIKTPLADSKVSASFLHLINHLLKCLFLVSTELLVVFNRLHIQLMLGLRFWGLEWAGQDSKFHILQMFGHLRM